MKDSPECMRLPESMPQTTAQSAVLDRSELQIMIKHEYVTYRRPVKRSLKAFIFFFRFFLLLLAYETQSSGAQANG
jgi:hypothetical protein